MLKSIYIYMAYYMGIALVPFFLILRLVLEPFIPDG